MVTRICRKLLRVALLRYVDDLFSVERASLAPPAPARARRRPRSVGVSAHRHGTRCNAWYAWSALCSATRRLRTVRQSAGAPLLSWACRSRRPPRACALAAAARALTRAARLIAGASALVHPQTSVKSGSSGFAPLWQRRG